MKRRLLSDCFPEEQERYLCIKNQFGMIKAREYLKSVVHLSDLSGVFYKVAIRYYHELCYENIELNRRIVK
jgi:hypothetical protein